MAYLTLLSRVFCTFIGCLFAAQAYAQSLGQPLAPKHLFSTNVLNVHSPDSDGWVFAGSGGNGISFAKRGAERNETFGAQAILIEMPETNSNNELIELVAKRIAVMNPSPRFREVTSSYEYSEDRGYPCVNVRMIL